jgi:amidase
MTKYLNIFLFFAVFSCKKTNSKITTEETPETETESIDTSVVVTNDFREFKVLDSKYINTDKFWKPFNKDLEDFTEEVHNTLKPFILEQDISTLQSFIANGELSYERLTKFYLYRIRKFDRENSRSLNSVIALNPNVIQEAREADNTDFEVAPHPIFGMPILLKDNINAANMPTTAGTIVLANNRTTNAFIVNKLKQQGALILGKANLSEWAYFFCGDCPSGYSAIGDKL